MEHHLGPAASLRCPNTAREERATLLFITEELSPLLLAWHRASISGKELARKLHLASDHLRPKPLDYHLCFCHLGRTASQNQGSPRVLFLPNIVNIWALDEKDFLDPCLSHCTWEDCYLDHSNVFQSSLETWHYQFNSNLWNILPTVTWNPQKTSIQAPAKSTEMLHFHRCVTCTTATLFCLVHIFMCNAQQAKLLVHTQGC